MKTCFVVMGFGKKMDYVSSKIVDLDITYNEVIKPLFKESFPEYQVVRADEICRPGSIDRDMYELLFRAELVIADITIQNSNAIYELGVRHALRPASTIIIMQKRNYEFPFDISHLRIVAYESLEGSHKKEALMELKDRLGKFIQGCDDCTENHTDSPVYTSLNNLLPPKYRDGKEEDTNKADSENTYSTIAELVANANANKSASKFKEAAECWKELRKYLPHYPYIVQQLALTTYKSKFPSEREALENAFEIIKELNPDESLDLETLGISGAICKRMNSLTGKSVWLDKAIRYYKKGYVIKQDYYNGENYANCLFRKMKQTGVNKDDAIGINYERINVCKEIIEMLSCKGDMDLDVWECASLAACNFHLNNEKSYEKYRELFVSKAESWMKETFSETINELSCLAKL